MGKKNKGKGAEKTLAKTEKKFANKLKKELKNLGEVIGFKQITDDIESIVAQIEKEEKRRVQVTETVVDLPSRRLNFTFLAHPDKEQLILYGGEFFNGQKTVVHNDLLFYNIPSNTWTVVKAPGGPPPRCGHQMVVTSTNKGQLWLFGGEFASPTQSQFYHYNDLWVYHLAQKQWEKINAPNGPSARSGHRMVFSKKQLFIFGGYYDNLRNYKYYNDIYSFNIETYKWTKLSPTGTPPAPRSGCCMTPLADGKILIYGGYSKEQIKKDVDKGHVHTDSFLLVPNKNDTAGTSYKWIQTKLGGIHFSPRASMPITTTPNNTTGYCFGGVFDVEEDEENIAGNFFNDFYQIDLEKLIWKNVTLSGIKEKSEKTRRRKNKDDENADNNPDEMEVEPEEAPVNTTVSDDGIFKVVVGPASITPTSSENTDKPELFRPSPRINCGLAIKHGILYLYGGMYEDGDKQVTYNDFYSLDLRKLDQWKTIISDDKSKCEWLGSDSESDDEEDDEDESDESDMDTE